MGETELHRKRGGALRPNGLDERRRRIDRVLKDAPKLGLCGFDAHEGCA
jgi:hypothetical protein